MFFFNIAFTINESKNLKTYATARLRLLSLMASWIMAAILLQLMLLHGQYTANTQHNNRNNKKIILMEMCKI
jgi:hypothetical protein